MSAARFSAHIWPTQAGGRARLLAIVTCPRVGDRPFSRKRGRAGQWSSPALRGCSPRSSCHGSRVRATEAKRDRCSWGGDQPKIDEPEEHGLPTDAEARRKFFGEFVFAVDCGFPDSPWCRCARRRTGVKMAGGTACDVVFHLVRLRPPDSLTLGAGSLRGRSLLLRARGSVSSARPRLPGRYHLAG